MMYEKKNAFTLMEILLAMTILALVIGSVVSMVNVGVRAFFLGKEHLELYQNARIALRKMGEEFRFSLAADSFWRPRDTYKHMTMDMLMNQGGMPGAGGPGPGGMMGAMYVEEEDPGAVRFLGEKNSVLFVRKKYQLHRYPPFDLQECRIFVDKNRELLVLEIIRSLLDVKRASWFYEHFFQVDLSGIVLPGGQNGRTRLRQLPPDVPMATDFIGDYGFIGKKTVMAEGVQEIAFRYSDGNQWSGSWNSQQLIEHYKVSRQSPNFNPMQDIQLREMGPPSIVEMTLTLNNGDTLATATDVPAGERSRSNYSSMPSRGAPPPAAQQPKNETPAGPGRAGSPIRAVPAR